MNTKNIAAQLYTLRNYLKTPEDIKMTMEKVKKIGYNAVQLSGLGPIDPYELNGILKDSGLEVCATHIPFQRLINETAAVMDEHKLWGCSYAGLGYLDLQFERSRQGYERAAEAFSQLADRFSKGNIKFVYHNHKFEFEKYDGKTGMDILFEKTDPRVGFLIDTYWVQAGGANPAAWIKKAAGRVDVLHLKDMAINNDTQIFAEIGNGNMDWPLIIDASRQSKVKWYAVEQDECQGDPFDSLAMSLKYLHNFLDNEK